MLAARVSAMSVKSFGPAEVGIEESRELLLA